MDTYGLRSALGVGEGERSANKKFEWLGDGLEARVDGQHGLRLAELDDFVARLRARARKDGHDEGYGEGWTQAREAAAAELDRELVRWTEKAFAVAALAIHEALAEVDGPKASRTLIRERIQAEAERLDEMARQLRTGETTLPR